MARRQVLDAEAQAKLALARIPNTAGFAAYCLLAHDTDMPQVADGAAAFAEHHWQIAERLTDGIGVRGDTKGWADRLRIIYVSATAAQAYKMSNAVKNTIEFNGNFQGMFPAVKPDKNKWSEPEWKVKGNTVKDSTFLALGRNGPVLGSRGDLIVLDDIVDDSVRHSPAERDAVRDWLNTTLLRVMANQPGRTNHAILAPRESAKTTLMQWFLEWVIGMASLGYGCPRGFRMICTKWYEGDPDDWATESPENGGQGWQRLLLRALIEDEDGEHSYWPQRISVEELQLERKIDPMSFAMNRQNTIVPDSGEVFRREHFSNRFDYAPHPDDIRYVFTSWDTAATITGRSFTAGVVVIVTKAWQYFVVHLLRDKLEFEDLERAFRDVATRFKPTLNFVEYKSSGIGLVQNMNRSFERGEGPFACEPLPPAGQKGGPPTRGEEEWVQTVTPPYAQRRVWLPSRQWFRMMNTEAWDETFIAEHLRYPAFPNDIVIAMSQLIFRIESQKQELDYIERRKELGPMRWGNPRERKRGGRRPPVPARRLLA